MRVNPRGVPYAGGVSVPDRVAFEPSVVHELPRAAVFHPLLSVGHLAEAPQRKGYGNNHERDESFIHGLTGRDRMVAKVLPLAGAGIG